MYGRLALSLKVTKKLSIVWSGSSRRDLISRDKINIIAGLPFVGNDTIPAPTSSHMPSFGQVKSWGWAGRYRVAQPRHWAAPLGHRPDCTMDSPLQNLAWDYVHCATGSLWGVQTLCFHQFPKASAIPNSCKQQQFQSDTQVFMSFPCFFKQGSFLCTKL